jgi:hypothetical protein
MKHILITDDNYKIYGLNIYHVGYMVTVNEDLLLHSYDDTPSMYYSSTKYWHKNGYLHRTTGPAIQYKDNLGTWFVDGNRCFGIEDFFRLAKLDSKTMCVLKLKYSNF